MKLEELEIVRRLAETDGWNRVDEKWITKRYRFSTFPDAIRYVQKVAEIAERLNHHPFIAIDYKLVTLKITSWHASGLTELDFTAAAAFDEAYP